MPRMIDCPNCDSNHTFPIPETMWMRFCGDCDFQWDIRSPEEIQTDEEWS